VETPAGLVAIEDLKEGDSVYSVDPKTNQRITAVVSKAHARVSSGSMNVTFSNGRSLRVTDEHPFYSPESGDYKRIGDFREGDELLWFEPGAEEPVEITIRAIRPDDADVTVYNITVEGDLQNYLADGVLVHNKMECW
jgi:intein/homing endonuclease